MQAAFVDELGGIESLKIGARPDPVAGPGEVLVRVLACGVNFADTLVVQGRYQEKPDLPFSPGIEICGEVAGLGDGVEGFDPGTRVVAILPYGGLSELVTVDARTVLPIPADMDPVAAAAFPVAYGTSHLALDHRAGLKAGETLLVHGAAGGVGLTAVEIGKLMGARVIATASTPEKLAIARSKGADDCLLSESEDLKDQVKALTDGRGADVIYDPVGGPLFDASMRCVAFEGRIVVIGFASGTIPKIPANILMVKNVTAVGLYWGAYSRRNPQVLVGSLRTLFDWYAKGRISPHVSAVYPLVDAGQALRDLAERRSTGKVVVRVAE